MNLPNEDDWCSEAWSLDTKWAYEHFHGKTTEESVRLFEENALYYQEDMMYMPSRVFGYYLKAYIAYLMSDAAKSDADGASCFISLIAFTAEHNPDDLVPLWTEVEPVLKKLADGQDDFDADWGIYGSFRTRVHEIAQRGFDVSFDTMIPEIVPKTVTLQDMALYSNRAVSFSVAVQVFRNSGINDFHASSRKQDVLRILGPPDVAGGGDHSKHGHIPEWIRYEMSDFSIRFSFEGDSILDVFFMRPTPV